MKLVYFIFFGLLNFVLYILKNNVIMYLYVFFLLLVFCNFLKENKNWVKLFISM